MDDRLVCEFHMVNYSITLPDKLGTFIYVQIIFHQTESSTTTNKATASRAPKIEPNINYLFERDCKKVGDHHAGRVEQ